MKDTSPSVVSGMLLAGKYRIDRLLGEGGMGVVLAATNEALRQKVAIKLLRSGALANPKALGRFEREARAAASLRSEHVARVLDVGKLEDGRPYMVMEYLEGRDLGDVIDDPTHLRVSEAVDFVLQVCEAIAEAHAAGIIHRDLKPKNLFLTTTVDGRPHVKVLDFGISKMEEAAEDMSLTRTTEIIGSPSYMSPEQLRASKEVDVRTDIWALGVILYELLTKQVPFQALTVTELVAVVLTEPLPDPRVPRPDVPAELAQAIAHCLAKRREDRFATVSDVVRAIAPFGTASYASVVDRVSRVASGSGRTLPLSNTGSGPQAVPNNVLPPSRRATVSSDIPPARASGMPHARGDAPPPTSSARLAINGGTSVAWGETQVDRALGPPHAQPRSRWPIIAVLGGLFLVLTGTGAGTLVYMKRASATETVSPTPPPPASIALPENRKDLPPINMPTADTVGTPSVAEAPSALPSTRVPTSEARKPPPPRIGRPALPPTATTAAGATTVSPSAPQKGPEDLSNIGRR